MALYTSKLYYKLNESKVTIISACELYAVYNKYNMVMVGEQDAEMFSVCTEHFCITAARK